MLEKLTGMVTKKLATHREYTESELEVIHYGLYGIFANILQFVLLGILAIPLGIVPQLIAYLLFYEALRRYAGGAHAESQGICIAVFTAVSVILSLFAKSVPRDMAILMIGIAPPITLIITMWKAPVMHPNNPKSKASLIRFRKLALQMAIVQLLILWALAVLCQVAPLDRTMCLGGALGGLTAACTLLFASNSNVQKGNEK